MAPIGKVEAGVSSLLSIGRTASPTQQAARLRTLLRSRDRFEQVCALEYVEDGAPQAVKRALKSEVSRLRASTQDRYLRAIAESAERAASAKDE